MKPTQQLHDIGHLRRKIFPQRRFFSRASRSAVRFFAAAVAAFLARADRSSGVIVSRLRLPPIFPPLRPISRITSEISFLLNMQLSYPV